MSAPAFPTPDPSLAAERAASAVAEATGRITVWLHGFFPGVDGEVFRWIVCLAAIAITILLRRLFAAIVVHQIRRHFAGKAEGGTERELLTALQGPMAALLMVAGVYAALTVLELPPGTERLIDAGTRAAFLAVLLWGVFCVGAASLAHFERHARRRDIGIAAFMPLIRKTLAALFVVVALLFIAESLGADVKTFLAGLGIGGLAVALAAQDTIANMFGSFVVVLDRPFRVGDTVSISGHEGTVEDIGLRSTRLRTGDRTLIVLPNKLVASEPINNLSRMPQRRVDQTLGLTYATDAAAMEAVLQDIRALLREDPGVHPELIAAHFTRYGESSLDIEIVYFTSDPDWRRHLAVRERVNLKLMRAVEARGLGFAFPTRTVVLEKGKGGPAG